MITSTETESDPRAAITRLRNWLGDFESALVAYSGGVDSALVLAAAHDELGDRVLGCIGISPSYPHRELMAATDLAKGRGIPYRLVRTQEHLDPRYAANPLNRCYFCKSDLYARLGEIAAAEDFAVILDGTNATDLGDYRPGYRAATERGVRSPLAELNFTKADVRAMARQLGLPVWDKPAMPCLASRVPHGTPVVPLLLRKIEQAEDVLAKLGFRQFRVRHHGDVARVELPTADLQRALSLHSAIDSGIRSAGYRFVCLDLAGFTSGSLNADASVAQREA
jgi:uncharacterized protein